MHLGLQSFKLILLNKILVFDIFPQWKEDSDVEISSAVCLWVWEEIARLPMSVGVASGTTRQQDPLLKPVDNCLHCRSGTGDKGRIFDSPNSLHGFNMCIVCAGVGVC